MRFKTNSVQASITTKERNYSGTVIVMAAAQSSPLAIQQASGFTPYVSAWPDDATAICKSVSPRHIEGRVWEVDVECSDKVDPNDDENPLNRPMVRTWSAIEYDTYPYEDVNGVVIANSAGQLFRDSVSIPKAYGVLTVTRNEASFDYTIARGYTNRTNSGAFYGAAKGEVLCKPITATEEREKNVSYAKVNYVFHFTDPGEDFKAKVLQHGNYFLTWVDNEWKKTLPDDKDGVKFSDVIMLDQAGRQLSEADIQAGNFQFAEFDRYKEADFGALNLE